MVVLSSSYINALPSIIASPEVPAEEKKYLFEFLKLFIREDIIKTRNEGGYLLIQLVDVAKHILKIAEEEDDDDMDDVGEEASRFLAAVKRKKLISEEEEDNSSDGKQKESVKLREEIEKVRMKLAKVTREKGALEKELNTPCGKEKALIEDKNAIIAETKKLIMERDILLRENAELNKKNEELKELMNTYNDIPKEFLSKRISNIVDLEVENCSSGDVFSFENNEIKLRTSYKMWHCCLLGKPFKDV